MGIFLCVHEEITPCGPRYNSDRQMVELIRSVGYCNMIAMLIVNTGVEFEVIGKSHRGGSFQPAP